MSEEVKQAIDDEPGPAGDFMKCYVTTRKEKQFFFNTAYLMQYTSAKSDVKRKMVPGKCLLQQNQRIHKHSL